MGCLGLLCREIFCQIKLFQIIKWWVSRSCIARVYYCFHPGSLQQIVIKIFSLVYLHFENYKVTHLLKGFPRYRRIRKRTQLVDLIACWPIKWLPIQMWARSAWSWQSSFNVHVNAAYISPFVLSYNPNYTIRLISPRIIGIITQWL